MDLSNSQPLLYYKQQINTTIPQTNIISTIKQLIKRERERERERERDALNM